MASNELSDDKQHYNLVKQVCSFSSNEVINNLRSKKTVRLTYLNPEKLMSAPLNVYRDFILRVDGKFLAWLYSHFLGKKIERASFDFSSLAGDIFKECKSLNLKVGIIGAKSEEVKSFSELLKDKYELNIVYCSDGYFSEETFHSKVEDLIAKRVDFLLIGMGGVRQDIFASHIAMSIPELSIFTCGAFISQSAMGGQNYYPKIIRVLDVRWLYRFFKEPRTIARVFKFYLRYFVKFFALMKRLN